MLSDEIRQPQSDVPARRNTVHYTHRPSGLTDKAPLAGPGWREGGAAPSQDSRWVDERGVMGDDSKALWERVIALQGSTTTPPTSTMIQFVILCAMWYTTSAMSSNTAKPFLDLYRYPVTLTIAQFGCVALYCLPFFSSTLRMSTLRTPTWAILRNTAPMALFQVGGHVFSSMAISRVPVSTVHTIKALSPLFTVGAYAVVFGVTYSPATYMSLIPLTAGVMLACTFDMSASDALGMICAFSAALVAVSQNIFFKKIMPSKPSSAPHLPGSAHKLDRLNLLFYTSSLAFLFMIPLWLYSDAARLWTDLTSYHPSQSPGRAGAASYYLFLNVTVHFGQNLIAYSLLSITSPVTYSIASLVKRIAVICIAILWFRQSVHPVQAFGIALSAVGLWMYNNAKGDIEKGEKRAQRVAVARDLQLPLTKDELKSDEEKAGYSVSTSITQGVPLTARGIVAPFGKPAAISIPSYGVPVVSPADHYPSPPDSRDSPPMKPILPPGDQALPSIHVDGQPQSNGLEGLGIYQSRARTLSV